MHITKRIDVAIIVFSIVFLVLLIFYSFIRNSILKESSEIPPELISDSAPEYPIEAFNKSLPGAVWVKVFIDSLGNVTEAEIIKISERPDLGFEEAAIKAAKKSKWNPAISAGKPVGVWISYKITFDPKIY
jgi:TonB family protein